MSTPRIPKTLIKRFLRTSPGESIIWRGYTTSSVAVLGTIPPSKRFRDKRKEQSEACKHRLKGGAASGSCPVSLSRGSIGYDCTWNTDWWSMCYGKTTHDPGHGSLLMSPSELSIRLALGLFRN
jgi:hypothetical protein